jgi:hypothetical protein
LGCWNTRRGVTLLASLIVSALSLELELVRDGLTDVGADLASDDIEGSQDDRWGDTTEAELVDDLD